MFTIYVKRDALEYDVEIRDKEDFVRALEGLYDLMEKEIQEKNKPNEEEIREKVYKEIWGEILEKTGFEDIEDFWDRMKLFKNKGLLEESFDYDDWAESVVDSFINNNTDFCTLSEMQDRIDSMIDALSEIYSIANNEI